MAGQKREARLARAFAQMSRPSTSCFLLMKKVVDARVKPAQDEW
jgi:hypothetical protein